MVPIDIQRFQCLLLSPDIRLVMLFVGRTVHFMRHVEAVAAHDFAEGEKGEHREREKDSQE